MNEQRTAAELARFVADTLEQYGIPYAIGGAIALGFYAAPRATLDVDVNVFLPPATELHRVLAVLGNAGFTCQDSDEVLRSRATTEGQIRGTIGELRVDVFVPAIAYSRSSRRDGGTPISSDVRCGFWVRKTSSS